MSLIPTKQPFLWDMYLILNTKCKRPCHVIIINTTTFVGEHLLFRSRCIFHRRITHRKPLIVCEVLTSIVMDKGKGVMGLGRRWAVEFTDNSTSNSVREHPDPPGFNRSSREQDDSAVGKQKKDAEANWKAQKAWEVAQAPFKNLFMMAFMMWMAGSTVNIFSIGITISALFQPINALRGVGKVFEPYKDNKVDLLASKLVFVTLNLVGLGIGIWKLNTLGLLPTHVSDWVSSLPPAQEIEYSGGGIPLH